MSLTYEDISANMIIPDGEAMVDKSYARDIQQYKRAKDNHGKIAGRGNHPINRSIHRAITFIHVS